MRASGASDDEQFRIMALRLVGDESVGASVALREHRVSCIWCRFFGQCKVSRELEIAWRLAVLRFLGEADKIMNDRLAPPADQEAGE